MNPDDHAPGLAFAPVELPAYHFESSFTRVGSDDDHLRVTATGSQTFVTRIAEAAASAFEEVTTR